MSMINKEISDFSVQAFHNDDFKTVTKDDVIGHWSVFFFYPADFTFVCPTELEDLGALYGKFQEAGCEVYSVSCDTHFVHKALGGTAAAGATVGVNADGDTNEQLHRHREPMDSEA